jgi:small-conductance mechanosensitive channel
MIKKLCISLALLAALAAPVLLSQPSYAINILNNNGSACNNAGAASKPALCKDNSTNASNPIYGKNGILTAIINILAKIVGVVSVIIIVISGIRMIMSQDAGASAQARRAVISAVVGLIIALLAQALVSFVLSKL